MFSTRNLFAAASKSLRFGTSRPTETTLVQSIRKSAEGLRTQSSESLQQTANDLRQRIALDPYGDQELVPCFALACETLRRSLEIELYDQQLLTAIALIRGSVAEMQTGEGKTLSIAPVVLMRALTGLGVHVANPNSYLAERDGHLLQKAFDPLGLTIGILPEQGAEDDKRIAYQCDATYGTAYEFGFDFLRDQLAGRSGQKHRLGRELLDRLRGATGNRPRAVQRGLAFAVIDEIDNVLLDDAVSPLVLSEASSGEARDAQVHTAAREIVLQRLTRDHFEIDSIANHVKLTPLGQQDIHHRDVNVPIQKLVRPWSEYVEQALSAEHLFARNVHYVVESGEIRIVDSHTGRIFQDRTWRDGLHQAIETKEGLKITEGTNTLAQVTRQKFFRLYKRLCGTTGTATGCEPEFRHIFGLRVVAIPLRVPSLRQVLPLRTFSAKSAKFRAIAESVEQIHRSGRPILIGTKSIVDSEQLSVHIHERKLAFQILNGRQDADEAAIIARAGEVGCITIATNLAGRGTDIRLGPGVRERGGLHVIVAECFESSRITRQLVGRCCRQGDPGSTQTYVSAEDSVLQRYGGWLADFILKNADREGELRQDVTSAIARVQRYSESRDYVGRCELMRRDDWIGSLISPQRAV